VGIPLHQALSIGLYVLRQHLRGRKRYPLVLMLEPLFRCNLACAGCGKIDYPDKILNQRLSVADCMEAVDECGAPVVVLAGGEPLLHKELPEIVTGALAKGKFVTVCTNALLMDKRLAQYKPHNRSIGRCISTATRECMTSRCASRASTRRPSQSSGKRRPRASVSISIARSSTMPSRRGWHGSSTA
jgi:hopanoid biosynthesis associated radical SAM protein HpnH